jgi:uncharacterized protein YjbJ (UPF0337 family)
MNNRFAGMWKQVRGEIKRRWGKLTDDDLEQVDGSWEKFVGKLQERYGHDAKQADREAKNFFDTMA